jgi:3'-phosphoadenosine 5'-phosphosulfate sulfotransferase (PAPS reductase)/FAD synthetase
VRTWDNVDIITPEMRFDEVISTYGYPLIGKEVAEAIYYARRITTSDYGKLRRADISGDRTANGYAEAYDELRSNTDSGNLINTSGARNRRTVLQGRWGESSGETDRRRNDLEGKWQDEQRESGSGPNALKKILNGEYERREGKSMFNKEKWLPLARDAPFLISHYCCFKMKKSPMHKYQTQRKYKPILATLAEESRVRKQGWIRHGCNAFESKTPMSQPMSFWTEQDVLAYIVKYNVQIASVYGDIVSVGSDGNSYPAVDAAGNVQCNLKCSGCQRTGCVFCAFGAHMEKKGETRFQQLAKIEPRKYEFAIGGGQWADNPYYDPTAPKMDGEWQNWNPKQIWVPSKKGLGLKKVFDICNEMYGKDFIRYE